MIIIMIIVMMIMIILILTITIMMMIIIVIILMTQLLTASPGHHAGSQAATGRAFSCLVALRPPAGAQSRF